MFFELFDRNCARANIIKVHFTIHFFRHSVLYGYLQAIILQELQTLLKNSIKHKEAGFFNPASLYYTYYQRNSQGFVPQ